MTDPQYPSQHIPLVVRGLAGIFLRMMGWRVVGDFADMPKCVIVAQHTSMWDAVFSVTAGLTLDVRARWLGKAELFRGWRGTLMRFFGGIPVDRSKPNNLTVQMSELFAQEPVLILFVTPEGSRKKREYWKTGFYHIALDADVPIAQGYLDYPRKHVGVGQRLHPSGDMDADMDAIRTWFADTAPKYPDKATDIRLKPGDDQP